MKLVIAYSSAGEAERRQANALQGRDFQDSVTNGLGCGQQMGYHESYRGVDIEVNLLKKVRLEIAVNEHFVKPTIDAIIAGARTETIGDGKIFVLELADCIRIRTGDTGPDTLG